MSQINVTVKGPYPYIGNPAEGIHQTAAIPCYVCESFFGNKDYYQIFSSTASIKELVKMLRGYGLKVVDSLTSLSIAACSEHNLNLESLIKDAKTKSRIDAAIVVQTLALKVAAP